MAEVDVIYPHFDKSNIGKVDYNGRQIIYMKPSTLDESFEYYTIIWDPNRMGLEFGVAVGVRQIISFEEVKYVFKSVYGIVAWSLKGGGKIYRLGIGNFRPAFKDYAFDYDNHGNMYIRKVKLMDQFANRGGIETIVYREQMKLFLYSFEVEYIKRRVKALKEFKQIKNLQQS
jgi:hypothetical protein